MLSVPERSFIIFCAAAAGRANGGGRTLGARAGESGGGIFVDGKTEVDIKGSQFDRCTALYTPAQACVTLTMEHTGSFGWQGAELRLYKEEDYQGGEMDVLIVNAKAGDMSWQQLCAEVNKSGDTVIVGDERRDSTRGAADIYVRSGTTWALEATLTAPARKWDDKFGLSVAIAGDTVVIGFGDGRVELRDINEGTIEQDRLDIVESDNLFNDLAE